MRGSISALAAAVVVIASSLLFLSAYLRLSQGSIEVLRSLRDEVLRVYSVNVEWIFEGDRVTFRSSSPVRVLAVLSIGKGNIGILSSEFILDREFSIEMRGEDKILLVLEGGRHLLIDRESSSIRNTNDQLTAILYELRASSRLLPLLAKYLDPVDYAVITDRSTPLNISQYRLNPHYRPTVTWRSEFSTRYCYDDLLYVKLSWNSTHWIVTYRKCASDGPILDILQIRRLTTEVPYREYLYYRECSDGGGVRHCFDVYATARGRCVFWCENPPDSRWFFEVGMRVEYRFEPLEPDRLVLVVVNRTFFENAFLKACVTCARYLSSAGLWCWRCSNNQYVDVCSTDGLVSYVQGPRPVFVWDIRYDENFETYYNYDDGYEMGAWYSRVELEPSLSSWKTFSDYSYTLGDSAVVRFYLSNADSEDFLARVGTHQYGYYRISFDLVLDEGGLKRDSRVWDYRVVVFLLRSLSS